MKPEKIIDNFFGMQGVAVWRLPYITDRRGLVWHLLDADMGGPPGIAEVYASGVIKGAVKAWHLHKRMTLRYTCIVGEVMVGLCDVRPMRDGLPPIAASLRLSAHFEPSRVAVVIPPYVWNGFRIPANSTHDLAVIINAPDAIHDPAEILRVPPDALPVKFDWGKYEVAG